MEENKKKEEEMKDENNVPNSGSTNASNECVCSEGDSCNNKEDEFINLNVNGLQQYKIIPETRTLIIGGKEYEIDDFFDIKHAIAGDFKTLDYIFTYKGFNIREFEIKKHKV